MLRSTFYQLSFTDINPDALGLPMTAFERFLHDRLPDLVSMEDFSGFYHPDGGPDSCDPMVLFAMLLLQFRYAASDSVVAARARRDLGWKYAMRLGMDAVPPSATTFKRFRANVRKHLGEAFVHERVLRLAQTEALCQDSDLQVVDSTNTDCRGAILDTYNLIARAIGDVLRRLAEWQGAPLHALAERLELSEYLARSVKGCVDVDWTQKSERHAFLTRQVLAADGLVAFLRSPELVAKNPPPSLTEAVGLLARVAHQDVEVLADGTFGIRDGTAPGRIISITDVEARHGRKSASKVISGHKVHVLATVTSQIVTAIRMTDAATHDGAPCAELLRQADGHNLKPTTALGDLAYGGGAVRRECAALGVTMLTKLPATADGDALAKGQFTIDLAAMRVTCPGQKSTERYTMVSDGQGGGERVAQFVFDREDCQACPLAAKCCAATRRGESRVLKLSPYEVELQETKAFNQTPEAAALLRKRSSVERIISHLVRFGMRSARYFGQAMTQFQAFMTAAAYNLQRVATLLVKRVT